jgi:ornithine cyclodeaminase
MAIAMRDLSRGKISGPPRQKAPLGGEDGTLLVMLASSATLGAYAAKLISVHNDNGNRGLPVIQGAVLVFDYQTGSVVGIAEASSITYLRTAAMSALATRELSRPDAKTHGIAGTGVQAEAHLQAIGCVRQISEVRVWARQFTKAETFVKKHQSESTSKMVAVQTMQEAASCDIVSCTTGASRPILHRKSVRNGAHVNLVGSHTSDAREGDSKLIVDAKVFVDSRNAAVVEAGDLIIPYSEGVASDPASYPELGELLDRTRVGREFSSEITIFKSVGVAAADLYAAKCVLDRAEKDL